MKWLLGYRFYCLRLDRRAYGIGAVLVVIALTVTGAGQSTMSIPTTMFGQPAPDWPPPEQVAHAFQTLCRSLQGSGYLFLIPAVLCGVWVCSDYRQQQLVPVLAAGYSHGTIHAVEAIYVALLQLGLLIVVRALHMGIHWEAYRCAVDWVSWRWFVSVILLRGALSLGNLAFFLTLAACSGRREIVLMPGFLLMALETLQGPNVLCSLLPTGGIQAQFGFVGAGHVWLYLAECLLLIVLSIYLPVWATSKIKVRE